MEFIELAEKRYSCRSFTDQKIEKEKLDLILKAGQVAPTARNQQPIKVLVIQSDEALEKYRKCTTCHFNEQLALITCYDKNQIWHRTFDDKTSGDVDTSIVHTHMMLQAADLGIGSTWILYFDPDIVRKEFNLPDNIVPVSLLALGYAAEDGVPSPRHTQTKPIEELVVYDTF